MNSMAAGCRLHPVEAALLADDCRQLRIAGKVDSLPSFGTEQRGQLLPKVSLQRQAARAISLSAPSLGVATSSRESDSASSACSYQPGSKRGLRSRTRATSGNGQASSSAGPASGDGSDSDNPVNADVSSASYGGMLRGDKEERDFVRWFREAWPYIQGHRGSTFVIVIPGEVVANTTLFDNILQVACSACPASPLLPLLPQAASPVCALSSRLTQLVAKKRGAEQMLFRLEQ